ncbi:MAG: glycosyltransferase family 4 protein [Oscillospiraceae bacterium]|nr:glycosyltransferase family 4 protein [Oscillospiraceae bacterium]
MEKKRLMFYINTLGTGGAERVMSQLAAHFCRDGYDVFFVTSFPIAGEYPLEQGVTRLHLEEKEIAGSRIKRNVTRIAKLRKLCKKYRPDVLIAFMQEPNFRAILAAIGLPVKTVISVRNDPNREYAGKVGRFVGKYILPMADGCVFQTEQAKAWFPEKLQKKSKIIFNEVAEGFFEVERNYVKNVITVGRLTEQKNHPMLIRAFAKIADKYPEQKLLIYGKGDKKEQLESLIRELGMEDRVLLMGATTDVPGVLAKAQTFVLSSDYEGMPNALMEALAVGVPSISTACPCGGPEMLIANEQNGLLVSVRDEVALASAMDRLLGDPTFAQQMGVAARERAKQYMPEEIFEQWGNYISGV